MSSYGISRPQWVDKQLYAEAAGQVAAGQVAAGQIAAGQVAAGQIAAGQWFVWLNWCEMLSGQNLPKKNTKAHNNVTWVF